MPSDNVIYLETLLDQIVRAPYAASINAVRAYMEASGASRSDIETAERNLEALAMSPYAGNFKSIRAQLESGAAVLIPPAGPTGTPMYDFAASAQTGFLMLTGAL